MFFCFYSNFFFLCSPQDTFSNLATMFNSGFLLHKMLKWEGVWDGGGGIYRVCGLRLGPNFGMRLTAKKNFYLRLTVEKIDPFAVFSEKYLRSYGCMKNWNTNWNHRNIEVIGIKIYFIIKTIYLLFSGKLVSSHLIDLIDLVISSWLMRPL